MPMLDWGSWLPEDSGISAFTYDFSISYCKNNTISSCLWTCNVYHIPLSALWTFNECLFLSPAIWTMNMKVYPFFKCWNVGLSGIQLVHTGMNKNLMTTYRIKLLSARSIYSLLRIHLAGHYMNRWFIIQCCHMSKKWMIIVFATYCFSKPNNLRTVRRTDVACKIFPL